MSETKVIKGRITYFEPNELFGVDNQPVSQEDLSKYVNLSVMIPSRNYNDNCIFKKYDSVLRGTGFEKNKNNEYTKFYLTDNYVNVSYNEFKSDGKISSGELFGIESINISFDVQLQPIVVINFIDVKGMGLMSTMEYNYESDKIKDLTAKSFFTSLFNFPYPIFTLEVKGYYGNSVSFNLVLKDFNTFFDSTSGNFKTSVSFIGHLYGVYGDIPMSFIMASPYFDYDGSTKITNNSEQVGNTWNNLGAPNIPTYIGLLSKFKEIITAENLSGDTKTLETIANQQGINKKIGLLNEFLELCNGIIEYGESFLKNYCEKTEKSGTIYVKKEDNSSCESMINSSIMVNDEELKFYDETNGDIIIPFVSDSTAEARIVSDGINVYYEYKKIENELEEEFKLNVEELKNTISIIDTNYKLIYFKGILKTVKKITDKIDDLKTKQEDDEVVNNAIINVIENKIGFRPCIMNIYQMLFKHINCFSDQFYSAIENVGNRSKGSLKIEGEYITDVSGYEEDKNIPPFPMFAQMKRTKENGVFKEIIYPGLIESFFKQPEIILVEKIYDSLEYFSNKIDIAKKEIAEAHYIEETGQKRNLQTGSLFGDLVDDVELDKKNYFSLMNNDYKNYNDGQIAESIRDIFLSRLAAFVAIHENEDINGRTINNFIDNELNLLNISDPELSDNVAALLDNLGTTVEDRYNDFKKQDSYFVNYKPKHGFDKNQYDTNDIIDNSIYSKARILHRGDFMTCKSKMSSFAINDTYKTVFTYWEEKKWENQDKNWWTGTVIDVSNEGADNFAQECKSCEQWPIPFNKAMVFNIALFGSTPKNCGDDTDGRWIKHLFFRSVNTIYVNDGYDDYTENNKTPFFDWALNSYYIRTQGVSLCSSGKYILHHDNYDTKYTRSNKDNKIALLSLGHLVAIGGIYLADEARRSKLGFQDSSKVSYNDNLFYKCGIPLDKFSNFSSLTDHFKGGGSLDAVYRPSENVKNDAFKDATTVLYKYFYRTKQISYDDFTEKEKKYCEYFLKIDGKMIERGELDKFKEQWYLIGREHINKNNEIDDIKEVWNRFIEKLYSKYEYSRELSKSTKQVEDVKREMTAIKTNIYYTLKALYDKWFCSLNRDFFQLYNRNYIMREGQRVREDSEFSKIKYLTTTFNDISESLIIDIEAFTNQILSIKDNPDNINVSVLTHMARTAQDNQSTFLVLPTNVFEQNLEEAFSVKNFYNGSAKHDNPGSTYVIMYNGDVSHVLDTNNEWFEQDGYTIADYHNDKLEITNEASLIMAHEVESKHNFTVNAFGVTYGMQNQNIFKNISVDTQTPQITDYSIANMMAIAEQGSDMANGEKHFIKTQSLYPVYANRSYNCTVEMMGCMNISPLMYFQLNNIPMFKGAYIITNVEHNITANDFVTKFSGVRVSKYNIPINKQAVSINRIGTIENINEHTKPKTYWVDDLLEPYTPWLNNGATTVEKNYNGTKFKTIDADKKYWFPYNGQTSGRTIDGQTYYSYKDDCMASVRKSIAMILEGNYNANSDSSGISGDYTSSNNVIQLLCEKYDDSDTGGNDYNLYYEVSDCKSYKEKYVASILYMTNMIDNGFPICVGVTHSLKRPKNKDVYDGDWLNEGVTDHFLCVYAYARIDDTSDTKYYFKYYESGRDGEENCASDDNILTFKLNNDKPLFYNENTKHNKKKRYDVSQIRINKNHMSYLASFEGMVKNVQDYDKHKQGDKYLELNESYRYLKLN